MAKIKQKPQYKVWMVVEKITFDKDGDEEYEELSETMCPLLTSDSQEEAVNEMNKCIKM